MLLAMGGMSAMGACAGRSVGGPAGLSESASERADAPPAPPVQFLYRRDRERLRAQQERAMQLAERAVREGQRVGGEGGIAGEGGGRDVDAGEGITSIFGLPNVRAGVRAGGAGGQREAGREGGLGSEFESGEDVVIGVGREEAIVAKLVQWDLAGVRLREGSGAVYTLQVARYGHARNQVPTGEELVKFREAAEEATLQLRSQGEDAFFFHGRFGSTVTIGLFGEEDYVTQVRGPEGGITQLPKPYESAALSALRAKFPHNLVNGATFEVRNRGSDRAVIQPSFIVRVPR